MAPAIETPLREYARFLLDHHLDEVTRENIRVASTLDVPLMKLFAHLPEEQLFALSRAGQEKLLGDLAAGTAIDAYSETLRQWEADELPGISKDAIHASDLVLAASAQKRVLASFVNRYTPDVTAAIAIINALEDYYMVTQDQAFRLFTRMREENAERLALAQAEKEAALATAEEQQALNEELASQAEELEQLYGQLKQHSDMVEGEVAERTVELAGQKLLMERIIDQAPAGIGYMDLDLIVRWVNPEFLRLFEYRLEDFIDRSFFAHSREESRVRFEPILRNVIASGEPYHALAVPSRRTVDGQVREGFWDISYVPVFGADQAVEGVLVFALEASSRLDRERFQAQRIEELQGLDRMKDEFLNALSFQIGSPINQIIGYAGVLEEGAMGSLRPEQETYVKRILAASTILLSLVNDLLDMSRFSAGKFRLERDGLNMSGLAERVIERLSPMTEQQGLRVIRHLASPLPGLDADEQRVEQVLVGMMSTAIALTPPGGMVRVQVSPDGGSVRCEIQHTGAGLTPEVASAVFERFTQLGGRWLGLTIARRQIEAHGGQVGVESRPGDGNTFWFSLPTRQALSASLT